MATPSKLSFFSNSNKDTSTVVPAPTYVDAVYTEVVTGQVHPVPSSAKVVYFASSGNFLAKPNAIPALPGTGVIDGTAGEYNPSAWSLSTITGIGVRSTDPLAMVYMSFYS